jgi:hypothetical protein
MVVCVSSTLSADGSIHVDFRCLPNIKCFSDNASRSETIEVANIPSIKELESETLDQNHSGQMAELRIGEDERNVLVVNVLSRTHPQSRDSWDGNWLNTEVRVKVKGFTGRVSGYTRTEEFTAFHEQLERVNRSLNGGADFRTVEKWITIRLQSDIGGYVSVEAEIFDQPGVGNRLSCNFDVTQASIPPMLNQLQAICSQFPVRSEPKVRDGKGIRSRT